MSSVGFALSPLRADSRLSLGGNDDYFVEIYKNLSFEGVTWVLAITLSTPIFPISTLDNRPE